MDRKALYLGVALTAVTVSVGAEEPNTTEILQEVAHAQCADRNNQKRELELERSDLVSSASFYKVLPEPAQTKAVDGLLKQFSDLTKKIQDLGEQNVETESLLFRRGLDSGPCSPLAR